MKHTQTKIYSKQKKETNLHQNPSIHNLAENSLAFQMLEAAKVIAFVIEGNNLDRALSQVINIKLPANTQSAIKDMAYQTLRQYGRASTALKPYLQKELPQPYHALLYVAFQRLEAGFSESYAIVDQAVHATSLNAGGLKGVINAVLRNVLRNWQKIQDQLAESPVSRYQHPAWWINKVKQTYPENWIEVLNAANYPPPMSLRVNLQLQTLQAVQTLLKQSNIESHAIDSAGLVLKTPQSVWTLPGFKEGFFSVQDIGAQHAAQWLDVQPEMNVLDACAAPGGKASHILELTPSCHLTALEISQARAKKIEENFERLHLNAQIIIGDAQSNTWWDGKYFDRILADVPCSASGVVRRHPDVKWLRQAEDIRQFRIQQSKILSSLWQTLKIGGKMLYVTCSIFNEENSEQIRNFCLNHKDAVRLNIEGELEKIYLPSPLHDGFYYALLQKTAS